MTPVELHRVDVARWRPRDGVELLGHVRSSAAVLGALADSPYGLQETSDDLTTYDVAVFAGPSGHLLALVRDRLVAGGEFALVGEVPVDPDLTAEDVVAGMGLAPDDLLDTPGD